jgi:hypothetical protein
VRTELLIGKLTENISKYKLKRCYEMCECSNFKPCFDEHFSENEVQRKGSIAVFKGSN